MAEPHIGRVPPGDVRGIAQRHRSTPGPLLPILHEVQEELGCIPASSIAVIAEELNLSRADVHGVASFYTDFRRAPLGQTHVRICRGEACQAVGAEGVFARAREHLGVAAGETTPDGRVTFEQAFCFGNCALGPSVQVEGVLYGRVRPGDVVGLLERDRDGGAA